MTPYTCPHCGLPCVETVYHEGPADCVLALKAELALAKGRLANLLARVFRDGGHRQAALGDDAQAVAEADAIVARLHAERDQLAADLAAIRRAWTKAAAEYGRIFCTRTTPRPDSWKPSDDDRKVMAAWNLVYEAMRDTTGGLALLAEADELRREVRRLRKRLNHQTADDVEACRQGRHPPDCGA